MVELQTGGLIFNGLDVMMSVPDATYGYRIRVISGGTEFGNPDAVISNIQSQLQDGDLQRVDRFGNRQATLDVRIDAPEAGSPGSAVAAGQRALELAAGFTGWAELQWTSPLADAETSVMEMTSAVVAKTLDTGRETSDGTRVLTVTIGARPHVRPTTKDTFDAPAVVGSTTTTVDSGSSTTGWSMLSTAPAPMANRISNPSFESNTTGWSSSSTPGTASLTRDTSSRKGRVGVAACAVNGPTLTSGQSGVAHAHSPVVLVTPGESLRLLYRQQAGVSGFSSYPVSGHLIIRFYTDTSAVNQLGVDIIKTYGNSPNGLLDRAVTVDVPSGAASMRAYLGVSGSNQTVATFTFGDHPFDLDSWIDQVAVIEVTDENPVPVYFDGSTTDTTALTYTWDGGTTNNSTSTATWTAPTLAVASGAVKGTVYGRASALIRRNNTGITSTDMATLPYLRIRGTVTSASDGQIAIGDNGTFLSLTSYSYNKTTGAYDIIIYRPGGFTTLDVRFTRNSGTISTTSGIFVAVDQIDITDNPFNTGKVQSRQISIDGSQRTELSLSVLGLDAAGTSALALGEQVLVHSAAAGEDGAAKFLSLRTASGLTGTIDSTAVSGAFNALGTTGTPTSFMFTASTLLTGTHLAVARVRSASTGTVDLSARASVKPTTGDPVFDPPTGWKTAPLTIAASGASWPATNTSKWVMIPLGLLRLPPADIDTDSGATITIDVARGSLAVDLDDVFVMNVDVGQASFFITDRGATAAYSAVRVNAATVDAPQASGWVGNATAGSWVADSFRWIGEQHQAAPGLLQVSSVTPGCATSRLAGSYYRRYAHDVASSVAS